MPQSQKIRPAADQVEACPFCGYHLSFSSGQFNKVGRCDTDDCWMNGRRMTVPLDDPHQVEQWNRRKHLLRAKRELANEKAKVSTLMRDVENAKDPDWRARFEGVVQGDNLRLSAQLADAMKLIARFESANEQIAGQRSARTYHSIIQDGAEELLQGLDSVRRDARAFLAQQEPKS